MASYSDQYYALVKALRGEQDAGEDLVAAPIPALNRTGQAWVNDAKDQALLLAQGFTQDRQAQQAAATAALARAKMARQEAYQNARLRLEGAKVAQGEKPSNVVFVGADNQALVIDKNQRHPVARPVVGENGKPVSKGRPKKYLGPSDNNELEGLATQIAGLTELGNRFRNEYAGQGPAGSALTKAYQLAGSAGTKGMQDQAKFWADYQRMFELETRHKLFGSALTPTESALWEKAQNARAGNDPKVVRQAISDLIKYAQDKLTARAGALDAQNFDRDAIRQITRGYYAPQQSDDDADATEPSADDYLNAARNRRGAK